MKITINERNISDEIVTEKQEKVRALIITDDNKILVANYGGVLLLPGGKIDPNESLDEALIRELCEELGTNYKKEELKYFLTLNYYQDNYPTRDGNICNRKITTYYYLTHFKEIVNSNRKLTEKEIKGKFKLELLSIEELKNRISEINEDNPRSIFFNKELSIVLSNYLNYVYPNSVKQNNPKVRIKQI